MYLLNAFSLQMVQTPCTVKFTEVSELPAGLESAVDHADTAAVLGVPMNRVNVSLKLGDVAFIAQLMLWVTDFRKVQQPYRKALSSKSLK